MKHFYLLVLGLFFSSLVTSQTQIKSSKVYDSTFYFYTIYYGYNNDVYISDVYELEIERDNVFKNSKDRFENIKQFIKDQGIAKDIQTGYEKNYYKKDQAENERDYLMSQFINQDYKVITFKYK